MLCFVTGYCLPLVPSVSYGGNARGMGRTDTRHCYAGHGRVSGYAIGKLETCKSHKAHSRRASSVIIMCRSRITLAVMGNCQKSIANADPCPHVFIPRT